MKFQIAILLFFFGCVNLLAQGDSTLTFTVRKPPPSSVEVHLKVDATRTGITSGTTYLPEYYNGLTGIEEYFETNLKYPVRSGQQKATVQLHLQKDRNTYRIIVESVSATKADLEDAVAFWTGEMANWNFGCYMGDDVYLTMEVIFKPWQPERPAPVFLQTFKPFPGLVAKKPQEFRFNAADGFFHYFPNGTHLSIPPFSFQDARGDTVKGNVRVTYCDYHTLEELMARGISTGITERFIDNDFDLTHPLVGGVIEFRAYKNGTALQISPGKNILLEMVSTVPQFMNASYWIEPNQHWVGSIGTGTGNPYHLDTAFKKRLRLKKIEYKKDTTLFVELDVFANGDYDFDPKGTTTQDNWLTRQNLKDIRIARRFYWKIDPDDIDEALEILKKKKLPDQEKGFFKFAWLFPEKSAERFVDVRITAGEAPTDVTLTLLNGSDHKNVTLKVTPSNKNMTHFYDESGFKYAYNRYRKYFEPRYQKEFDERFDYYAKRKGNNFLMPSEYRKNKWIATEIPDTVVRSFFVNSTGFFMCSTMDTSLIIQENMWNRGIDRTDFKAVARNQDLRFADSLYQEITPEYVFIIAPERNSVIVQDSFPRSIPVITTMSEFLGSTSHYIVVPLPAGGTAVQNATRICNPDDFRAFDIILSGPSILPAAFDFLPGVKPGIFPRGSIETTSGIR